MPAQLTRLPTTTTGSNQTRLHETLEALNNFFGLSGNEWNNPPGGGGGKGWDQVTAFNDKLSAVAGGNLVDILQAIDNFDFSGGADTNFANDNLTATSGNITHEFGGNSLAINNMSSFSAVSTSTYNMQAASQITTFAPTLRLKSMAGAVAAPVLSFTEGDAGAGEHFIAFKAPDDFSANATYTWPDALPVSSGQVLSATTGGVMSWTDNNDTNLANGPLTADADYAHNWANFDLTFNNVDVFSLNTQSGSSFVFAGAASMTTFTLDLINATNTSGGQLNLYEASTHAGGNFVGIQGPDSNMASSYTLELPVAGPTANGQALTVASGGGTANAVMEWTTPGGGADTNFAEDNLTADAHRLHNFADKDLEIDNIQTLTLHSALFYFRSTQDTEPAALDIFESVNSGNDYVRLAAPASVINTYTIEFPDTTGSAGQVLSVQSVNAGVHTMEWSSAGGADTHLGNAALTADASYTHTWGGFNIDFNDVGQFDLGVSAGGSYVFAGAATFTTFALSMIGDVSTNPGVIQLYEPSQYGPSHFAGFQGPSSDMAASYTMELPAALPSNGQYLKVASGGGGSSPVLEFGDELNRKEGADNLGNVSGSVNVDFDAGSYDNKRYTINGDVTFTVAMSAREGTYRMYLNADASKRQISWVVSDDSESIYPTYIVANDTLMVTLHQRGGAYHVQTSDTTRQIITHSSIGSNLTIDTGGVYRNWEITGDAAGFELELPNNMPANTVMEIEFSSSQSVVPTLDSQWVNMSPAPTHNNRCIYVIRRTGSTYYICRKDEE